MRSASGNAVKLAVTVIIVAMLMGMLWQGTGSPPGSRADLTDRARGFWLRTPSRSTWESPLQAAIALSSASARQSLLGNGSHDRPFDDVHVAISLGQPLAIPFETDNPGSGFIKLLAAPDVLRHKGKQCIVYGLGIADNPSFEIDMAGMGCSVHAFDCTSDEAAIKGVIEKAGVEVELHKWCVGTRRSFEGNQYSSKMKTQESAAEFYPLADIQSKLGHPHLDVLKFDIEGWEWELLHNHILPAPPHARPDQIIFELHTEGANPVYVPPGAVSGRSSASVNALFLALWDIGYRVISKAINPGDARCAEFSLLRVQ